MIKKFAALLLIGMASPYQILDWYGGRRTCHTASGAPARFSYSLKYHFIPITEEHALAEDFHVLFLAVCKNRNSKKKFCKNSVFQISGLKSDKVAVLALTYYGYSLGTIPRELV